MCLVLVIVMLVQLQMQLVDTCTYTAVTPCSDDIIEITSTPVTQTLCSPNYPNFYPNNEMCRWVIKTSQPNEVIRFELTDLQIVKSTGCGDDYLEVRDGETTYSRSIQRWCGSTAAGQQTSSVRAILVTFKTNLAVQARGFQLKFWSAPGDVKIFAEAQYSIVNYILFGVFGTIIASIVITTAVIALVRLYKHRKVIEQTPVTRIDIEKLKMSCRNLKSTSSSLVTLNTPV